MKLDFILDIQKQSFPVGYTFSILIFILLIARWLKKGKYVFIREIIFIILSLIATLLITPYFHNHFFEWGQKYFEYRSNLTLDSTFLNSYLKSTSNDDYRIFITNSLEFNKITQIDAKRYGRIEDKIDKDGKKHTGVKNSHFHNITINKNDALVFKYKQDIPLGIDTRPQTITLQKNGYTLVHTINSVRRSAKKTFIKYMQAVGKGQVFYAKPSPKYTDIFCFNAAVLLLIIALFMALRYGRSLKQIRMIRDNLADND